MTLDYNNIDNLKYLEIDKYIHKPEFLNKIIPGL